MSTDPCQLDRVLNPALRKPNDLEGVRFGYVDGQPSDTCAVDFTGGWHTIVIAVGPDQSVQLREEDSTKPFFSDLRLEKWCSPSSGDIYRNNFVSKLADPSLTSRLRIYALSYREDIARRAYPKLLERHFRGPPNPKYYEERHSDQKGHKMVRFPDLKAIKTKADGTTVEKPYELAYHAAVPLFIMGEHFARVHEEVEAIVRSIPQPYVGMVFISDKINGDGVDAHPKIDILRSMVQSWYPNQIRPACYIDAERKSGEFLADNASGLLTTCLNDSSHRWIKSVKAMRRNKLLRWSVLDLSGNIKLLSLP